MKLNEIQIIKARNSFDSITIALLVVVVGILLAVVPDVGVEFEIMFVVDVDADPDVGFVVADESVDFESIVGETLYGDVPGVDVGFSVVIVVVDVDVEFEEPVGKAGSGDVSVLSVVCPAISCLTNP